MGSKGVVAFFHFGLDQPLSAGHRQWHPGVVTHAWEVEGKMQPGQPCVTLSVGNFCAALKKL